MRKSVLIVSALACATYSCLWAYTTPKQRGIVSDSDASHFVGGQYDCWSLPPMSCGYSTWSCGTVPCTEGIFSWYCAAGNFEQTGWPSYTHCTNKAKKGYTQCYVPDQNDPQICATRQSCGDGCITAVSGPFAGIKFCNGPVALPWIVSFFPVQILDGDPCETSEA